MNTHDELERALVRELHDRAGHIDGGGFGFAEVKGRAGRIRRHRRIVAGAGVAAAVAVIVPGVIMAGTMLPGQRDIAPAPSPDPSEVARTTLAFDGLARGEAPAVEYFTPDGVVLPGAGLQPLEDPLLALVPSSADGGWLALGQDGDELRYLRPDFTPNGRDSASGLATTTDRSRFATTMSVGGVQTLFVRSTLDRSDGQAWDFPGRSTIDPVGFLAPDRVAFEILTVDGGTDLAIAEPDGSITPLGDFASLRSASPEAGLVAVDTRANDDGTVCGGVVDPALSTTEPVWETCDYRLGAFSPDGRYVMASSSYGDGFGLSELEVLDAATGALVASFTQTGKGQVALVNPVWESSDTILAVGADGQAQSIVRLGVDGTLEEAVQPVEGFLGDLHFFFGVDRTRL